MGHHQLSLSLLARLIRLATHKSYSYWSGKFVVPLSVLFFRAYTTIFGIQGLDMLRSRSFIRYISISYNSRNVRQSIVTVVGYIYGRLSLHAT